MASIFFIFLLNESTKPEKRTWNNNNSCKWFEWMPFFNYSTLPFVATTIKLKCNILVIFQPQNQSINGSIDWREWSNFNKHYWTLVSQKIFNTEKNETRPQLVSIDLLFFSTFINIFLFGRKKKITFNSDGQHLKEMNKKIWFWLLWSLEQSGKKNHKCSLIFWFQTSLTG